MAIIRTFLAVSLPALALAVAAPLLAQKPGAGDDPDREGYRVQGVSLCVAELATADGVTADDVESICGCAFDRLMDIRPAGALPPLGPGRLQAALGGEILSCTAARRATLAASVARRLAQAAASPPPAIAAAPPLDQDEGGKPAPADASQRLDLGPRAWLDGLSLPRWLATSDLPLWAWVPLVLFVFMFLRGLMRRRDGKDLMGPPRSLDPSTRRPDLPPPRL